MKDKGPFINMDPDLEKAVTEYGTPPYREIIKIKVRKVTSTYFDEMPETIEGWINWLEKAQNDAPLKYRDKLKCELIYESYGMDGANAWFEISYKRPETDEEMKERVGRGIEYVQDRLEYEKQEYERLKRKFES